MQYKKTKPIEIVQEELPELTDRQMSFVRCIMDGCTATDAYRKSYTVDNSEEKTIWAAASRLRNDPKIHAWLRAAKFAGLSGLTCTFKNHIAELDRLKLVAEESGNVNAAVQAEQLRGKACGHYIERHEVEMRESPEKTLEQIAAQWPDDAEALAKLTGLDWNKPEATKH